MLIRELSVGWGKGTDRVLFDVVLPQPAALLVGATLTTAHVNLYWSGGDAFILHYTEEGEDGTVYLHFREATWEEMLREPALHPLLVSAGLLTIDLKQALRLSDWLAESARTGRVPDWLDPYNGEDWQRQLDPR